MLEGDLLNDLTVYDAVDRYMIPTISVDTWTELWLAVSRECTLAACTTDDIKRLQHLVKAANLCGRYEILQPRTCPLAWLCYRLAPSGPLATSSPFSLFALHTEMINPLRSLRAFLTAGILNCLGEGQITEFQAKKFENEEDECEDLDILPSEPLQTSSENEKEETVLPWEIIVDILTECKNDLIDRRTFNYYKEITEIRNCEREVAKAVATASLSSSSTVSGDNGAGDNMPSPRSLISSGGADSERLKLTALKAEKEAFEKDRVAAPNPFLFFLSSEKCCTRTY